jgi:prepilin-type N-terminal cleavage/methylation domain-containing protein
MRKAFTMVELVFVIVILGILASFAIPKLAVTRDDAEVVAGVQRLSHMLSDIALYYTTKGYIDGNLSKMTNVELLDSTKNKFTSNFTNTEAFFGNTTRSKLCLGVKADDLNGTLTIRDLGDSSAYCISLVKVAQNFIKVHKFGGSEIYK